ncbi:PTS system mannose/fructose/sorbose family transporter subunit IID [Lactobacillus melliventris]|nr:PTS system mannose/fructose/sorbose family transporter subunit IID [Lactobacillus melliventris]
MGELTKMSKMKNIYRKVMNRWIIFGATSLNYEKYEGLGYTYAMLPFIEENYQDDSEGKKTAIKTQLQFFNTTPYTAPFIMGVDVGMEEKGKTESLEAVSALKTGLMGPLAGIGDSLFVTIPWTIFGAIAANMALHGNPFGCIMWIVASILLRLTAYPLFNVGYRSGTKMLSSLNTTLKALTNAASVLGLMVVGALAATMVKVNLAFTFKQGKLTMTGNSILDQIMPGLLPAAVVALIYYLLGKKVKPLYVILIVLVVSIALNAMHVLA